MDNPRNDANDQERDPEPGSAATPDELQRRQRGSLPSFLFITFLFFMLTNRNEEDIVVRTQYEDTVRALGYQLSNYSAWLNGTATNFTLVRGSRCVPRQCSQPFPFSQPDRDVHVERVVSNILPLPLQLDPSFGSYYSNASGLFRGDVHFYNLSSIHHDANVTWKPIADRVMENVNLSAIPERLGDWNWSAADTIGIRVHDTMATVTNVSESIAIFQVLYSLFYHPWCISKVAFRESSSCPTPLSRIPCYWSLMVCTLSTMALSMHLHKRKGASRDTATRGNIFNPVQVLVHRYTIHLGHRSNQRAERYCFDSTKRDDPSFIKAKDRG